MKVAPATCQVVQITAQLGPRALVVTEKIEAAVAIEVPRDDEDRLGGQLGGAYEQLKIVVAIDNEGDPMRMRDTAAVAAFDEETSCPAGVTHCLDLQ